MNVTVYLFGKLGGGYTQYPNDYAYDIFSTFEANIKSPSQIMIHRNDELIYYGYLRKLSEQGKYIGISFVFNGTMCTDIPVLCKLCEDNITNWVVGGEILEFSDNGDIVSKVDRLYKTASEFKRLSESLSSQIATAKLPFRKLPPINYSVSADAFKTFNLNENSETFNNAINDYSNIYIYSDSTSETLAGYSDKLRRLSKENSKLKAENAKVLREKKRTTIVTMLVIILAVGFVVILSLMDSSNQKTRQIKFLERDKTNLIQHVNALHIDSVNLTNALASAKETLRTTKSSLEKLRSDYSKLEEESNIQKQTISLLENKNSELENIIISLRNSYSSNYSGISYTVGASTIHSLDGHDASYAQWLYTTRALHINYFYVHPDKTGYITIGLYNSSGSLITSCLVYVYANQWNKISPNFELSSYTRYYLALKENYGISLGYHRSNSSEFNSYQSGSLQILGSCKKGQKDYRTGYYQYFYSINYSLKN